MRVLIGLSFLLIAAPAQAAPLHELPFKARPGAATCLRATGAPGTLAILGPLTPRTSATDLLADGTTLTDRVRLGALVDCAAVAADPGGAAVLAGPVTRRTDRAQLRAAVRDPAGAIGAPVTLGPSAIIGAGVAAAVSPAGHAVVAWAQRRGDPFDDEGPTRIVAARRAPGGAFGPSVALTPWRRGGVFVSLGLAAGIDGSGTATVAWLRPVGPEGVSSRAAVARAAPGAPFAVQQLATRVNTPSRVALAVAPDGSALLAYDSLDGIRAYERRAADAQFSAVLSSAETAHPDGFDRSPVVAVRNGGGGMVAWRSHSDAIVPGVTAALRTTAGPFSQPRVVARSREIGGLFGDVVAIIVGSDGPAPPLDEGNALLRGALAPDGRAILAWSAGSDRMTSAQRLHVATGSLAEGFGSPHLLGGPVRDVNGVAPLFLPDGRAAAAWTDNAVSAFEQRSQGRLHLAVEGAAEPAEPARPGLRVRAARTQRLRRSQGIAVRVSCVRACDLRATARSHASVPRAITRTLRAGRSAVLHLGAFQIGARQRRVRIVVTATAPGARLRSTVSRHIRVIRRIPPPVPPPLDVRAHRSGREIVVTWRTARAARHAFYVVEGRRARNQRANDISAFGTVDAGGRTRFEVRLTPKRPRSVHFVAVRALSIDGARLPRVVIVPVT